MLHNSAKELLGQLDSIIAQCREDDFSKPLNELSNATFGQHVRHTLEFFICLYDARNERIVNYDNRKHDREIETDRKLARFVIDSIRDFLEKNREDFAIEFEANYTEDEGMDQTMKSSFFRELAYNIEHAIHHMALMKVAVTQTLSYIELPENFGVASSTVRYRSGQKA
ncbi:MAG: DinB family protein [Ekhidna sp.]|nr:DinB family protein [Ekhidna sp.]MBC6410000.1 DinB family protein [Ekhidna sp.]MBC6426932.1 DinB family protein [Ekhidna sp.]